MAKARSYNWSFAFEEQVGGEVLDQAIILDCIQWQAVST